MEGSLNDLMEIIVWYVWEKIFDLKTEQLVQMGRFLERAVKQGTSDLDTVPFPEAGWERGCKEVCNQLGRKQPIGAFEVEECEDGGK